LKGIEINNLTKVYRSGEKALDDLSISVREGEIFTLLGENGAGKSTLINTLTTYLPPTSGSVRVFGRDLCREAPFIRSRIARVAQKNSIDDHLSLMENMRFQSRLYRLDRAAAEQRIGELIHSCGLEECAGRRVRFYSGGIKRRLDIAMSLISRPKILFLDEPTVALDVESRRAVWKMIQQVRREYGTTVFMTTHYLEEAETLSDRVCILQKGRELVQDTPENLRRYTRRDLVQVILRSPEEAREFERRLSGQPFVLSLHRKDGTVSAAVRQREQDLASVNRLLLESGLPYRSIGLAEPTLESIFLTLTTEEKKGA